MKNYYFIPLLFLCAMSQAQPVVDIPDANFKNALLNTICVDTDGDGWEDSDADTNDDGEIQVTEAESVVFLLGVGEQNISSLEGIQSFVNLEWLKCHTNPLTSLDVTQNPNLERLWCLRNNLTSLDVTQNPNLEELYCWDNQLINLDVTQNPNLNLLDCYNNQLSSLDVTQSPNLELLWCNQNQLTSLDVTQNTNLERLHCNNNQLTSLDMKNGNNHNMVMLDAYDNPSLACIQVDDVNYANDQNCADDYWCKDTWTEYSEECILGVENYNQITFTIFPNPTQDVLNIDSQEVIDWVRIYSINGSLIKETSNSSISVSELSKGLYFAQINAKGNTITKKFIKS